MYASMDSTVRFFPERRETRGDLGMEAGGDLGLEAVAVIKCLG